MVAVGLSLESIDSKLRATENKEIGVAFRCRCLKMSA